MKSERIGSKQKTTLRETFQFKNDEQVYARVARVLGHELFECECDDGLTRNCRIRGNMRNRVFVNEGDIVLVDLLIGLSGCECKGIISTRYSDEFVRELITHDQIAMDFVNKNSDPSEPAASHPASGFEFV